MHWDGWWHMGWMWIFGVFLVVALVFLIRMAAGGRGARGPAESAEDILKKRYARGEIDKEEYERKLDDLRR